MREGILKGLVRNISAGTRLALFLPVRWLHFQATPGQYALLAAFNMLVWVVSSTVQAEGGLLNPTALALYLAQIPLLLLASVIIANMAGNASLALLLAVALSASDLAFEVSATAVLGAKADTQFEFAAWLAFVAWGWAVAVRAVRVCTGLSWRRLVAPAGVITALMAVSLFVLPRAELWVAEPAAPGSPPALGNEEAFHAQGELIERQLAAIAPGRAGVTELYFTGFAPDGSQDVFLREMRSVKSLVERKFDAANRSIALISSPSTPTQYPIATATNLRRSLARIGERMNADEDILLLYVTAHGDQGHSLSGHAPPLDLAPINPPVLARALNDAGIKWRVLVISACYAGGFIEPLKDDNTLIITASAADRRSFGCENGNDWTYFGEAYFKQALARTNSFIDAFALAAQVVADREKAENLSPPSNPQMYVGRAIAGKLKDLRATP